MKHAAVLYTCVGLMGAAALAGFIDYSDAKSSGIMSRLYQEETASSGSTLVPKKDIELEDYSRGPIDERFEPPLVEELAMSDDNPKTKKRTKKFIPPPPPPAPEAPPAPEVKEGDIPSPPPPKAEAPSVPVTEPVPAVEMVKEVPPTPATETKEVTYKSFSRAPLKKKTVSAVSKRKE